MVQVEFDDDGFVGSSNGVDCSQVDFFQCDVGGSCSDVGSGSGYQDDGGLCRVVW